MIRSVYRVTESELRKLYKEIEINAMYKANQKRAKGEVIEEDGIEISKGVSLIKYVDLIDEKLNELSKLTPLCACRESIEFVKYLCNLLGEDTEDCYFESMSYADRREIAMLFCRKLSFIK